MPHNKTLGQKLKNPLWIIQTLASLCPFYGINIIDKQDEYQLTNFILMFKKFQFFAIGIVGGIVGFYLYFNCVDQIPYHSKLSVEKNCRLYGPGMLVHVRIDLISFGIQLILTWIVVIFLPFSEQKGQLRFRIADKNLEKSKEKLEKEKEKRKKEREKIVKRIEEKVEKLQKQGQPAKFSDFVEEYNLKQYDEVDEVKVSSCDRSGYMRRLILWDILTFCASFALFYYSFQHENKTNFEEAKAHIFFSKWMYSILTFPFLIFSIPLVSSLLSRARPTAYDEYGNTVPVFGEIDYQEDILGDIDVDSEMGMLPLQNTPQSKNR